MFKLISAATKDFQLAIGFFKNKHGKNGVVIDPLDLKKQFKCCESGMDYADIRFEGKSLRKHSAYAHLDTTGPIKENGRPDKQKIIEVHDDKQKVLMGIRHGPCHMDNIESRCMRHKPSERISTVL